MKRLLCIVSSLDTGGAETFMMKIFRFLPDMYKLDFIVSTETGFYEEEVKRLGGKIFRIPLRTKHPIKAFQSIKTIVRVHNYQYILKLCDTPIGYFDLLAARRGGASQICVRSCNANSNEGIVKKVANKILRPYFNAIVDVKIAPSRLAAEYTFGKMTVDNGGVGFLHNAVDLNTYKYDFEARNVLRQELGIRSDQHVCGHVGRFTYQKNHKFLLDIFKEVYKKDSNAVLLLVGDGEKRQEIVDTIVRYGIKDNVILTGVRADVHKLYSVMDVFLLPSLFEGMPNTVIEAQANGLRCVVADSITKEANVTGLVKYLPLNHEIDRWVKEVLECCNCKRIDTEEKFVISKYDMFSAVNEFIKLIFEG